MRESRAYGSGRGACDETHVPTATREHKTSTEIDTMNPKPRPTIGPGQ
jgi:hypothetical protein